MGGIAAACERRPGTKFGKRPTKGHIACDTRFQGLAGNRDRRAGDIVERKNEDFVPHTATAEVEAQKPGFDSGTIRDGSNVGATSHKGKPHTTTSARSIQT